jgi:two-component system nitrate/nitrite response regulator NarL
MDTVEPTRILLADDRALFRQAIASLLAQEEDMVVVGQAENGLEAVEQAHALGPDLIVMDIEMPVMNGVEAIRLIKEQLPGIKIVVLTVSEDDDYLFDAFRFGADGYLLKNLSPEQLYDLLRAVMRNETPLSPAIATRFVAEFRDGRKAREAPADEPEPVLTRRELEVLRLVADGLGNKEIGTRLSITEGTVKNHVHNALRKLQLENRVQATSFIVRHGLGHRPAPESQP